MNRRKAIIALFLALLYLPATGHCLLEQAGLLLAEDGDCCEQTASTDGAQTPPCPYGCCPIEYAVYFSPHHCGAGMPVAVLLPSLIELPLVIPPEHPQPFLPDSSPPELARVWQFSFRAARLPRAPSFAS